MKYNLTDIEELKQNFAPITLQGTTLPHPNSVADKTIFYLKKTDGIYYEHIMIDRIWMKKMVDADSNIILVKV